MLLLSQSATHGGGNHTFISSPNSVPCFNDFNQTHSLTLSINKYEESVLICFLFTSREAEGTLGPVLGIIKCVCVYSCVLGILDNAIKTNQSKFRMH